MTRSSLSLRASLIAVAAILFAASAAHAELVQIDLTGTASGIMFPIGPFFDEPYTATLVYDADAADLGVPGEYPLITFNDSVIGDAGPLNVTVEDDVAVGSDTVDRMTFNAAFFVGIGGYVNTITLHFASDFRSGVQLPTLAELTTGISGGKFLSGSGSGFGGIFTTELGHEAVIDGISAVAVPEPASGAAIVALLVGFAGRRLRREGGRL